LFKSYKRIKLKIITEKKGYLDNERKKEEGGTDHFPDICRKIWPEEKNTEKNEAVSVR
jgi:hypothetical protein